MSNIKGLYFKLNIEKQSDKNIYNFFIQESKKRGIDKISLLLDLVGTYKRVRRIEKEMRGE